MFVVFEGIDGSGKTTISNRVADRLKAAGLSVKHLRAGGQFASLVTQSMRELGRDARHFELEPTAEFLLYLARDVQLLQQVLRPALSEHDVVIADRSYFTAQVLGQFGRHLSPEWVNSILEPATRDFNPDLVVLVDVDPKIARMRRKVAKLMQEDKRPPSRKGQAGVGLQYRLRQGYLELAKQQPERWAVLPNGGSLEQAIESVTQLISNGRSGRVQPALQQFRTALPVRAPAARPLESPQEALAALLAWVDQRIEGEPQVAAYVLRGLSGQEVDERRRALVALVPEVVLAALAGLEDAFSWQLREQLAGDHPHAVARSLGSLTGPQDRAAAMRQRLLAAAPEEVMKSLNGADDEASWALRDRLFAAYPAAVVISVARLDGERPWALREAWYQRVGGLVGAYETARVGLKAITGLDEPRAWKWRKEGRGIAPIAALGSLRDVLSEKSWRWRQRFIRWAPKTVMATLRRVQAPEAWVLRQQVAEDCKEALDSIQGLADEQAWQLRDAHCDRWSSTVLKSLGPLSDTPRGQALLARQLQRYPDNLSVLQHASAICLGAHRRVFSDEE